MASETPGSPLLTIAAERRRNLGSTEFGVDLASLLR